MGNAISAIYLSIYEFLWYSIKFLFRKVFEMQIYSCTFAVFLINYDFYGYKSNCSQRPKTED